MEKAYKAMLGYKPIESGDDKHEHTHYILTIDEYKALQQKAWDAEERAKETERQADRNQRQVEKAAKEVIAEVQEERDQALAEVNRVNDLNTNLLRIARERANAQRGLTPKKTHDGYLVLSSQQFSFNTRRKRVSCWKTVVQTPYHASLPLDGILSQLKNDLLNGYGARLGLAWMVSNYDEVKSEDNTLFNKNYKANYKTGLWEVEYLHTLPITVPEDMRSH